MTADGSGVSLWSDGHVLNVDGGDGAILGIH